MKEKKRKKEDRSCREILERKFRKLELSIKRIMIEERKNMRRKIDKFDKRSDSEDCLGELKMVKKKTDSL